MKGPPLSDMDGATNISHFHIRPVESREEEIT